MKATYTLGLLRTYEIDDIDAPIGSLRAFLARNPEHVCHTNATVFEKLMADCLRAEFAPCEVIHVGQSHDKGIDIKLVNSDKEAFLIQVKRRKNLAHKESVTVVRELNGVLLREGVTKGMVITTASAFTRSAKEEVHIKTVLKDQYQVELRAFNDVRRMLHLPMQSEEITTAEPWKPHLRMLPANDGEYRHAIHHAELVR